MQVDDEFKIISDAYPYIASRLLTDPSVELQAALEQVRGMNRINTERIILPHFSHLVLDRKSVV